ncbi:MAG: von Willebrand factor type, partial [Frankiales bacterium]|nr:von Willebrand factor type [Frankiales bacterium]
DLGALVDTLRREADPARPVKVIAVGVGTDADLDALRQITSATGGATYSALDPNDLKTVLFDALRQRG